MGKTCHPQTPHHCLQDLLLPAVPVYLFILWYQNYKILQHACFTLKEFRRIYTCIITLHELTCIRTGKWKSYTQSKMATCPLIHINPANMIKIAVTLLLFFFSFSIEPLFLPWKIAYEIKIIRSRINLHSPFAISSSYYCTAVKTVQLMKVS